MDYQKEIRKREAFKQLLFDLAQDQELPKDKTRRYEFYKRFEELYCPIDGDEVFRHFYSDIFDVLSQIQRDASLGSLDILGQNLAELRKKYQAINKRDDGTLLDATDNIRKLYDHVSLDIARLRYVEAGDYRLSEEETIKNLQAQVNELSQGVSIAQTKASDLDRIVTAAQTEVKTMQGIVENTQKDYVAILGIFAAILLAFVGGLTFSTSVLENVHKASPYRVAIVTLIVGLVLINVLFGLFYYIGQIVRKENTVSVKPLLISNAICLLLLGIVCIAWWVGAIESRDDRILNFDMSIVEDTESLSTPNNPYE